jgi:2-polyprenyl-3-methyl-5-hydroxy-6-metoxy-1,4-benzoquinol methylase
MAKGISTAEMTDEQFVANLYRNLLQRSPKSGEVKHWTGVLATGSARSDVVEVFMSSSEFLTLQGQKERFQVSSSSRGDVKGSEQGVLSSLQAHVARQQSMEDGLGAAMSPGEHVRELNAAGTSNLSSQVWEAAESIGRLNPRNPGFLSSIVQTAKKAMQRSLTWYTRSLQDFHFHVAKALEEHGNDINVLDASLRRVDKETQRLDGELSRLDNEIVKLQSGYLQELLRANELAVEEQLVPYVEFFQETSPVLDLGCGRGEFLVLLKESGISSYGVDSDESACEAGRRKSVKIVNEDALEHLKQLPDRSLGGIFSARVIEFLPAHAQMELISLSSMKIKPGGVLVIETTNPDSRRGHGRVSGLDPTHLLAVPPELMKSALETNYFENVKIMVLAPVEARLAQVVATADSVNSPKQSVNVLPEVGNRLAVSPVYAVTGRRS